MTSNATTVHNQTSTSATSSTLKLPCGDIRRRTDPRNRSARTGDLCAAARRARNAVDSLPRPPLPRAKSLDEDPLAAQLLGAPVARAVSPPSSTPTRRGAIRRGRTPPKINSTESAPRAAPPAPRQQTPPIGPCRIASGEYAEPDDAVEPVPAQPQRRDCTADKMAKSQTLRAEGERLGTAAAGAIAMTG